MIKESFGLQDAMMLASGLFTYETCQSIFRTLSPGAYRRWQDMRRFDTDKGRSLKGFDERKCIFVHITKCAGISVGMSLFGNLGGGHLRITHYQLIFSQREFEEYFKFTFVRNPWDRLVSAFQFLKKGGTNKVDRAWSARNLARIPDFDTFVRGWVNRKNVNSWKHFVPQYKFVCEPRSEVPKVDFIGYFECLAEDFAYIQQKIGSNSDLKHLNKTEGARKDYRDYYTDATRKIVEDVYAEDIRIFGYDFDNASLKRR